MMCKFEPAVEEDSIGSLKSASFDIECDSSHGDFPIAIKDYNKLAQNIGNEYRRIRSKNGAVTPANDATDNHKLDPMFLQDMR